MQAFTLKNTVILSLVQVVVVVFGTLAAGLSYKLFRMMVDETPPMVLVWVRNGGVALLAVPLIWVALANWVRLDERLSDKAKNWTFASGFGCVILLVLLVGWATLSPWIISAPFYGVAEPR